MGVGFVVIVVAKRIGVAIVVKVGRASDAVGV